MPCRMQIVFIFINQNQIQFYCKQFAAAPLQPEEAGGYGAELCHSFVVCQTYPKTVDVS